MFWSLQAGASYGDSGDLLRGLQCQPKRHLTAIGITEDVDMFFVNLALRGCSGDQTLDESRIVDVFGMGWEGGLRMAVIPGVLIAIWVDDHKAMLIRQLVEFVACPLTHRLSIHQRAMKHNDQRRMRRDVVRYIFQELTRHAADGDRILLNRGR